MRKIVLNPFLLIFIVSSFFTACDDDKGDTEKPVINLIAPAEGAILKIGSDIHFEMDITDNEMLQSYKIEIHNNFDHHGHDTKATASEETTPFSFNKSWDVSGYKSKHEHHHDIVIPGNATEGDYHFMVYCTDISGNESYVARNIQLSHDGSAGEDVEHDH